MKSLFEIGQKVVCVDSKNRIGGPTELIEGKIYTVIGISINSCCKNILVDVGLRLGKESVCGRCGRIKSTSSYKQQERFVPLDFDKQTDEMIREQLNENIKIPL